jgi:hypothetical protein
MHNGAQCANHSRRIGVLEHVAAEDHARCAILDERRSVFENGSLVPACSSEDEKRNASEFAKFTECLTLVRRSHLDDVCSEFDSETDESLQFLQPRSWLECPIGSSAKDHDFHDERERVLFACGSNAENCLDRFCRCLLVLRNPQQIDDHGCGVGAECHCTRIVQQAIEDTLWSGPLICIRRVDPHDEGWKANRRLREAFRLSCRHQKGIRLCRTDGSHTIEKSLQAAELSRFSSQTMVERNRYATVAVRVKEPPPAWTRHRVFPFTSSHHRIS